MNSEIYSKNLLKILDFVKPKNKDVNMHENIVNILIMVKITLYNWIVFRSRAKNGKFTDSQIIFIFSYFSKYSISVMPKIDFR